MNEADTVRTLLSASGGVEPTSAIRRIATIETIDASLPEYRDHNGTTFVNVALPLVGEFFPFSDRDSYEKSGPILVRHGQG
ncbi:MAG: hypothetical protein KGJ23_08125 [Euryarchaeota archaeon]|nr:hypothetical protein [Euryarchaeota archaeon]MDE1836568.1 hypothetical protein [Euryarchaeota archaeon]MDE1879237.1 hypothetical protein [Euryarchaeota archaeon]MDE2044538.1 hypothetical protein [Thermoplasmata archaeon]